MFDFVSAELPVDRAVPLRRLERRGLPLRLLAHRHDVVVAIEQHRGRARRRGNLSDHDRRGVR